MSISRRAAVAAPAMLALSPQFAIWDPSGLETLLLLFWWCLLEESKNRIDHSPRSSFIEPDTAWGIMYVAVAFSRFLFALTAAGSWDLSNGFLPLFALYHSWRMGTRWPFPNTRMTGCWQSIQAIGWTIKAQNHSRLFGQTLLLLPPTS